MTEKKSWNLSKAEIEGEFYMARLKRELPCSRPLSLLQNSAFYLLLTKVLQCFHKAKAKTVGLGCCTLTTADSQTADPPHCYPSYRHE